VLGAVALGDGSFAGGCRALGDALAQLAGPLPDELAIADGSGLSRDNRVTAEFLVAVLEAMLRSAHGALFLDSLASGGVDGTLDRRFRDAPLRGRVRAKTGTLDRVTALSGIVRDAGDRLQAFSILMNVDARPPVAGRVLRAWQDRIVAAIHARS
jgi:D-alanyl-D-alanine carboxypeptidase/D-alanyl-D-alanine-endopeptidase (penicillin-binding protein 4)